MTETTKGTRDWLQEQLSEYVDCIENHAYDDATKVQEAILAALNADSARLDWLEDRSHQLDRFGAGWLVTDFTNGSMSPPDFSGATVREAIDKARAGTTSAGLHPKEEAP